MENYFEDLREELFTDYIQNYDHLSNDEISELVDNELTKVELFFNAHELNEIEVNDEEYLNDLYQNYKENKEVL
jgi:hypothetical protein